MWVKIYFSKSFFFLAGPFQGGYFLGGIIYFAALDLVPSTLNLRPAPAISEAKQTATWTQKLDI